MIRMHSLLHYFVIVYTRYIVLSEPLLFSLALVIFRWKSADNIVSSVTS
jgi:hypothetical protein